MPFIKVRQDGAITIPVELRRKHSIDPGAWYKVTVNSNGNVILSPQSSVCSLCGTTVAGVDPVTGTCPNCRMTLTGLVQEGMDLSSALKYMQLRRKSGSF